MDTALSYLISAGIIAFGVWIVVGTVTAGAPMAWTFMGASAHGRRLAQPLSGSQRASNPRSGRSPKMTLMASGHSFSEAAERPESVAPLTTAKPPARYRRYLRRASGRLCSTQPYHRRGRDPPRGEQKTIDTI